MIAKQKNPEIESRDFLVEVRGIEPRSQKFFTDRLQAYLAEG